MHPVSCAVRVATISSGESGELRAAAHSVLEEALDEIVNNDQREVTE